MTAHRASPSGYDCWLGYRPVRDARTRARWAQPCGRIALSGSSDVLATALSEARLGLSRLLPARPLVVGEQTGLPHVLIAGPGSAAAEAVLRDLAIPTGGAAPAGEVCVLQPAEAPAPRRLIITGDCDQACLHGVFWFLRLLQTDGQVQGPAMVTRTANRFRMIDHWDNLDGSVERGYSGRSVLFDGGDVVTSQRRVRDYARLLASTGVNAIAINNVNVGHAGAQLLTQRLLAQTAPLAAVFRGYGIRMFFSVDFASPILLGGLRTADPTDEVVRQWWAATAAEVYRDAARLLADLRELHRAAGGRLDGDAGQPLRPRRRRL